MSLKLERNQVETITALAPLQEGMLFDYMIDPNFHQVVFHYTLHGSVDPVVLHQALELVVRKHDILRSVFRWEGIERPVRLVQKEHTIPFDYFQSEELDGEAIEQAVNRIKDRLCSSIDLRTNPLQIALQQGKNEWHLIVVFHHIILDGWSNAIMMEEWLSNYEELLQGQLRSDEKSKLPYHQYVSALLHQDQMAQQKYWSTYLHEFNRPSFSKYGTEEYYVGQERMLLSKQDTISLQHMINESHVTWAAGIYTAWGILLQKYKDSQDLLFGITVSGRNVALKGIEHALGLFINTIPFRISFEHQQTVRELLQASSLALHQGMDYALTPLPKIREHAGIEGAGNLFDTLVVIENYPINEAAISKMQSLVVSEVEVHETTPYGITLTVMQKQEGTEFTFNYNRHQFSEPYIKSMGIHLVHILKQISEKPDHRLSEISFITDKEFQQYALKKGEKTNKVNRTLDQLFDETTKKLPNEVAVIFKDKALTYQDLNKQVNSFAAFLSEQLSVNPDCRIGLCVPRSEKMLIALLGILKIGAAFVPIDPSMPKERIRYMVEDSGMIALITGTPPTEQQEYNTAKIICLQEWEQLSDGRSEETLPSKNLPESLAYVIYTSGSTGNPKGVMVEHRNVASFFNGLNKYLRPSQGDALLAVTTISFDISILELLWTVCKGVQVVIKEDDSEKFQHYDSFVQSRRELDFSIFFFSSYDTDQTEGSYSLLLEAAKFADEHGFIAVWTPERHFHLFGGLFANPAVTGAALAATTKRIQVRAGSVVSPLHDPIRIAEEWAMIDNLSNGRAGLSFASGWHANDFALASQHYEERNEIMYKQIEEVKTLWSGGKVKRKNGLGITEELQTYPRPLQEQIPIWVTTSGNSESFERAGKIGAHVLTHLLGQDIEQLRRNIQIYRNTRQKYGHRANDGKVSLMLHAYIGEDIETVKNTVKQPFIEYLRSSASLVQRLLDALPEKTNLQAEEDLYEIAFERYWNKAALFGTKESVQVLIDSLFHSGVDEFACLVDFGLNENEVMKSLKRLYEVKHSCQEKLRGRYPKGQKPITMLQTTPARMKHLLADPGSLTFLENLDTLIIGGEAFPTDLIEPLQTTTKATIINAYGPTETTIWSALDEVKLGMNKVHIGQPLEGEQLFILDEFNRVMPPGMIGEIVIGGSGVVRGYMNRPELNAEKFITLPEQLGGGRAFKTGDRGRFLADGSIEFLGRKDYQVKLNGYRIELEEIEQVIHSMDGIVSAVVYDFESQDISGKQLAALIVAEEQLDMTRVREELLLKLPRYMVPHRLIQTESIPLNKNGKKDRHAARSAKLEENHTNTGYVAPRNDFEVLVIRAWEQVLGKIGIGIKDDFFALGGDSISAMRVIALLNKQGVSIEVRSIFERPTIEALAENNPIRTNVDKTKQVSNTVPDTNKKGRQKAYRFDEMTTKESQQVREALSQKTILGDRK